MPDIVVWDRFATPSNTKLLMPLDDLIAEDGVDVSKFFAEAYDELTVDGKQYGLPLDADPWGLYINMDMVEEYNATAAAEDKIDVNDLGTWTKVMDAAEKLTVRNGDNVTRSGINTTSADGQFFSFVYTGGGELIDTDKDSPAYGDTVSVKSASGADLGSGELYIHDELKIVGYAGTVSAVYVSEGDTVYSGQSLIYLSDTEYTGEYERLLSQRRELEAQMQALFAAYERGGVSVLWELRLFVCGKCFRCRA